MSEITRLDPRDLYHAPHLMGETVHRIEKVIVRQRRRCSAGMWLLVLEALTGELLALRVSRAEWDDSFGSYENIKGVDYGGMVYFRKTRFAQVAQMARIQQKLDV